MKTPLKLSFLRAAAAVIPILTTLATMIAPAALGQVTYWVTDLGALGGSSSYAACINNSGQIVGYSDTSNAVSHAFLYSGGSMADLGTLGGPSAYATCINNNRQIVGYSQISPLNGGAYHAFLYTVLNTGGMMTDFGTLGTWSRATCINNNGEITGNWADVAQGYARGFIYTGGTMTSLNVFAGANSINDSGAIVGQSVWSGNEEFILYYSISDITWLPLDPLAINNNGQIVGVSISSGDAALYAGGTLTDLGILPGGTCSYPCGINNNGQVVGEADTTSSGAHAFIYSGGSMTDLNNLIPTNSGWTLVNATSINDSGCIVGQGTNPTGQSHAFLLNPIPQVPHRAAATAAVLNGLVLSATITDSGYGYTNPPTVLIQGGGGTGATATAVISNGFVTGITITGGGTGYTNAPSIYIYSPLGLQIGLIKAVSPTFSDILIGTNYQLQVSTDLSNWTNQGSPFAATSPALAYPQYWNVDNWNQLFFRLQVSP